MNSTTTVCKATVDGKADLPAELTVEQEIITVRSEHATRPDPTWKHTDDAGHFHAWSNGDALPTLEARTRQAPCDGACGGVCDGEGYSVTEHFCRICDQQIEPGRTPDHREKRINGRRSWSILIDSNQPLGQSGDRVSVVVSRDFLDYFGVAQIAGLDMVSDGNGVRFTTRLHGISPLGDLHPLAASAPIGGMSWV